MLCHAAVELPILAICFADSAQGWRPLWDNAATAWRAYLVFTSNAPLVGHRIAGPFLAYGPGPLQFWLLAVPVRLDPAQGALWGSALFAVAATALGIEAGWSAGRRLGAIAVAAGILVVFITQWEVLVDPVWNASFGAIWFVTTIATGWAVASGRLRWWPVTVLAASIAAQCHEFALLPAAAVCIGSVVLGVASHRRFEGRIRLRWLLVGTAIGIGAWLAPLVQQFTTRPGNLTLLWRAAHRHVATLGAARAFGALSAMTRPYPQWLHAAPRGSASQSFFYPVCRRSRYPAAQRSTNPSPGPWDRVYSMAPPSAHWRGLTSSAI